MAAFPLITDAGPAIAEAIWGVSIIVAMALGLVAVVAAAIGRGVILRLEEIASAVEDVDATLAGIRDDRIGGQPAVATEEYA